MDQPAPPRADPVQLPQTDVQKVAQSLHTAADESSLFNSLPALHERQIFMTLHRAVRQIQDDLRAMQTEMNGCFIRLEIRISVVYVLISFTGSGLPSIRSDQNGVARTHNATITSSQQQLQVLETQDKC